MRVSIYVSSCEYVYLCVSNVCVCVCMCVCVCVSMFVLFSVLPRKSKSGHTVRIVNSMTTPQRQDLFCVMNAFKTSDVTSSLSPCTSLSPSPRAHQSRSPSRSVSPSTPMDMHTLSKVGFGDFFDDDYEMCPALPPATLPSAHILTPRRDTPQLGTDGCTPEKSMWPFGKKPVGKVWCKLFDT